MITFFNKITITNNNPVKDEFPEISLERNVFIWKQVLMVNECKNISCSVLYDILSRMHRPERIIFLKRLALHHLINYQANKYISHYLTKEVVRAIVENNSDKLLYCVKNHFSLKYEMVDITNKVNLNYNFVQVIFDQMVEKILGQYPEVLKMINSEHIILGETFCESVCNVKNRNTTKNNINIDMFVIDADMPVGNSRSLKFEDKGEYPLVQNKTYQIKLDNLIITISKHVYQNIQECMFENSLSLCYDTRNKRFYCNGSFYCYQKIPINKSLIVIKEKDNSFSKLGLTKLPPKNIELGHNHIMKCYVCKKIMRKNIENTLSLYPNLCISCAIENFQHRIENISLPGRTALVTGSRIKIGYAVSLELLRAGVFVISTTRFPMNLIYRFQQEPDYETFKHRHHIYKIDMRDIKLVEKFVDHIGNNYENLDIFINNACQTFTYDQDYYRQMNEYEAVESARLSIEYNEEKIVVHSAKINNDNDNGSMMIPVDMELKKWEFPTDKFGELITKGGEFWTKKADDVSSMELIETNIVNNIVPSILITKFKTIMKKSLSKNKYIINVTCKEGQFNVSNKDSNHYHTNGAKAAVNMMVRTVADDYRKYNIFINSVNPGFISYAKNTNRKCPLDCLDAARRILHPIIEGENTDGPSFGKIFKNYRPTDW